MADDHGKQTESEPKTSPQVETINLEISDEEEEGKTRWSRCAWHNVNMLPMLLPDVASIP